MRQTGLVLALTLGVVANRNGMGQSTPTAEQLVAALGSYMEQIDSLEYSYTFTVDKLSVPSGRPKLPYTISCIAGYDQGRCYGSTTQLGKVSSYPTTYTARAAYDGHEFQFENPEQRTTYIGATTKGQTNPMFVDDIVFGTFPRGLTARQDTAKHPLLAMRRPGFWSTSNFPIYEPIRRTTVKGETAYVVTFRNQSNPGQSQLLTRIVTSAKFGFYPLKLELLTLEREGSAERLLASTEIEKTTLIASRGNEIVLPVVVKSLRFDNKGAIADDWTYNIDPASYRINETIAETKFQLPRNLEAWKYFSNDTMREITTGVEHARWEGVIRKQIEQANQRTRLKTFLTIIIAGATTVVVVYWVSRKLNRNVA